MIGLESITWRNDLRAQRHEPVVVKQTCATDSFELCLERMSPPLKANNLVAICKDGGY